MTPEQWRRAKGLFHDALEQPDAQRAAFVERADAEPEVIVEVKRLLDQHLAARTFLETPAAAVDPGLMLSRASSSGGAGVGVADAPPSIGPYRILGVVGEGGMGVVYLAEQDNPRRTVALKVIRPGLASDALLRRFEHEAQALGRLQHPGIAQIHHAGMEGSGPGRRPYFAMELVKGEPLLAFAESRSLGCADRVALFIKVCDAVQHAHIKGVIHRDLKPANIVVGEDGQPKVLDFGVARLADSDLRAATIQTNPGQIVGTVPYMSPEQVAGDAGEVDTRSDVYALGVVLYELLAGRLPYDLERKSIVEAARVIREQPPTRLSSASRVLRGDLDVIVGKALEKDKARRYQSAAELSADLTRYLRHEPISARPASAVYQVRKFVSRHRALAGATGLVVVVLVGALVGVLNQRNVARRHGARATALNTFFMDMLGAANPEKRHGHEMTVRELLDDAASGLAERASGDAEVDEEIRLTLGSTYRLLGALDKAEPLVRDAAGRAEAALGPDHEIVMESLTTLGLLLSDRGLMDEAGPLLRRVYETRMRTLGERDKATLSAMNNWARWLDANGRKDEGLALMERAVRVRLEVLGENDRHTLISVDNLGKVMLNQGRLEEAEKYMRRANEGFRRTLGEDDPDTFASYQNLAELMRKRRRLDEAGEFARRAAEGRARVLGMDDRFTLYSINTRGRILMDAGRAGEAEPYLRESLEGIRRVSTPEEVYAAGWGAIYARCLTALSRFDEAEATLRGCEASMERAAGDTSSVRRSVGESYLGLYTAWNRPDDAALWRARLAR